MINTTGLKEKTIELIEQNPRGLDMSVWYGVNECGTVACLAGYICMAADVDIVRDSNGDFVVCNMPTFTIWSTAKYLWSQQYGAEAASKLPLLGEAWDDEDGEVDLDSITAEQVVDWLKAN